MTITNTLKSYTSRADVFAIFDAETGDILFKSAQPLNATVVEKSELMQNPREDGTLQVDHKVDLPTLITVPMLISRDFDNAVSGVTGGMYNPDGTVGERVGSVQGVFAGNQERQAVGANRAYRPTYRALDTARINGLQLVVQTKTKTHRSMFIESITRHESAQYYDSLPVTVTFKHAIIGVDLTSAQTQNGDDSPTVDRGLSNSAGLTPQQQMVLDRFSVQGGVT